ncbi:zonadhesin-like [Hyposmocoma kahamanoa]|uniref:zonadhesin-like n=1 Tax=Hyposmocoma kahamanoa TaxID=1477025 RepID=UPI000E6D9732|nr:zonadhesin-like [Hyposmocoma kahamanoa]
MIKFILFVALVANVILIASPTTTDCDDDPRPPPPIKTKVCPDNEEWNTCANGGCYSARNCSQIGNPVVCVDPVECKGGCLCKDKFLRNDETGVCVPTDECPNNGCHRENEIFDLCPPTCPPQSCGVNQSIICFVPNPEPGSPRCKPSCRCKSGYLRNEKKECVLPEQCDAKDRCTGPNEHYTTCSPCTAATCGQIGKKFSCVAMCRPACRCNDGYYRNRNGVCVLEKDCEPEDKCDGPNEHYTKCSPCTPATCDDIGKNITCTAACVPACRCDKGYYRNSQDTCVLEKDCPKVCPDNEEWNTCANGGCYSARNCSQIGNPVVCVDPVECKGGCLCKDKFLRNDETGVCIPTDECPSKEPKDKCTGPNEYFNSCASSCDPVYCNEIGKNVICAQVCIPACRCNKGYYRNSKGVCILEKDCPPTCSVNEEFSNCTQAVCRNQYCSQVGKPVACPGVTAGSCETGCVCKEGYYRDQKGNCIPEKECPSQCPANERYVQCPSTMCLPQRCDQLGYPIACPSPGPDGQCPGKPGCICDAGYVRNNEGKCVPQKECPSCGGDPNAESGCGNHCGRRCSDYKKSNVACPLFCMLNGCNCKKGYVYDDNIRKCVLPEDCTPDCPANEEWNTCANGGCYSARNCSQIGNPVVCVDPLKCKGGCLCKDKFLRNDETGVCVPIDKCPNNECGKNEVYDRCPPVCPPQECGVNPATIRCASNPKPGSPECKPSCRCKDGYVRNDKRECVLPEQCRM